MQNVAFYGVAFFAVAIYALMNVLAKKMQVSVPPFTFMAATMFVLALASFTTSLFIERNSLLQNVTNQSVVFLIAYGLINFVGFTLYLKAISGMPVANYSLMSAAAGPIVVSLLAVPVLGEQLSLRFFLAIPLVLAGLYPAFVK